MVATENGELPKGDELGFGDRQHPGGPNALPLENGVGSGSRCSATLAGPIAFSLAIRENDTNKGAGRVIGEQRPPSIPEAWVTP